MLILSSGTQFHSKKTKKTTYGKQRYQINHSSFLSKLCTHQICGRAIRTQQELTNVYLKRQLTQHSDHENITSRSSLAPVK